MRKQSEVAAIVRALLQGVITQRVAVRKLEKLVTIAYEEGRGFEGHYLIARELEAGRADEPDTIFGEPVREL